MKYVKGNVIFPERLLKEIQEYIQGEFVYIPQKMEHVNHGVKNRVRETNWREETKRFVRSSKLACPLISLRRAIIYPTIR